MTSLQLGIAIAVACYDDPARPLREIELMDPWTHERGGVGVRARVAPEDILRSQDLQQEFAIPATFDKNPAKVRRGVSSALGGTHVQQAKGAEGGRMANLTIHAGKGAEGVRVVEGVVASVSHFFFLPRLV